MSEVLRQFEFVVQLLRNLLGELLRNPQLWAIILLFVIFVFSIEMVEGYMDGPWPHQRRGDERFNPLALGSRSAWLAVAILLMPGLLLAVVNAVVRLYKKSPPDGLSWLLQSMVCRVQSGLIPNCAVGPAPEGFGWTLQWVGWVLIMLAWVVFVAGSNNVLHSGQYLRRLGLITPAALLVCLLLGNIMLLLSLLEVAR